MPSCRGFLCRASPPGTQGKMGQPLRFQRYKFLLRGIADRATLRRLLPLMDISTHDTNPFQTASSSFVASQINACQSPGMPAGRMQLAAPRVIGAVSQALLPGCFPRAAAAPQNAGTPDALPWVCSAPRHMHRAWMPCPVRKPPPGTIRPIRASSLALGINGAECNARSANGTARMEAMQASPGRVLRIPRNRHIQATAATDTKRSQSPADIIRRHWLRFLWG